MTNLLLVGCYTPPMGDGRGISLLAIEDGTLLERGLIALTESPSFLISRASIVYAVNEAEHGRVTSFQFGGEHLQQLSVQNTAGAHPCHLAVDPSGTVLAAANYTTGSVSLHRLDGTGGIAPAGRVLELSGHGPVAERQGSAHAHQVVFASDLMYVVDLGSDRIWRYTLNPATLDLIAHEPLVLPPGFGPRQLVVNGEYLYVLGELSNQLAVLRGAEIVAAVPAQGAPVPDGNLAAALEPRADGRLVVSHRGADRLTVFIPNGDSVDFVEEFSSGGAWPRHLRPMGEGYVVADQLSNTVAWLGFDGAVRGRVSTPAPTCICPL